MAITPEQFFGLIAVKNGVLTEAQLQECFRLQAKRFRATGIHEPLSYLLYELKLATHQQMRDVLQEFKYSCLRKDDRELADVALAEGWLDASQIDAALRKQREMFRGGVGTFQLGEILMANELLTSHQVFQLYCKLWQRRHPNRDLPAAALRTLSESEARLSSPSHVAIAPTEAESWEEPTRAGDREQPVLRNPRATFRVCPHCGYRNPAVAELCYDCGESLAGSVVEGDDPTVA